MICPLKYADETDDDEKISHDVKADSPVELVNSAAEAVFEWLQKEALPDLRSGLLHGGMKDREKNAALAAFRAGETQILVATTVVEVGVDNPNATLMLIWERSASAFRNCTSCGVESVAVPEASVCVLMSDTDRSWRAERFGYYAAVTTVLFGGTGSKMRGGIFGVRQHGIPEFRLANLYTDQDLPGQPPRRRDRLCPRILIWHCRRTANCLGAWAAFGERLTHIGLVEPSEFPRRKNAHCHCRVGQIN